MAVEPLFVEDMPALKAAMRLTGAVSPDALAMIDIAVQEVRFGFYKALEADRVAELLAITFAENPTSEDGLLRMLANTVEVAWVKMLLMRAMPVLFMDTSSSTQQIWNQEGLTRNMNTMAEIKALMASVDQGLIDLGGAILPSRGRAVTIGPDVTPPRPFDSIRPLVYS